MTTRKSVFTLYIVSALIVCGWGNGTAARAQSGVHPPSSASPQQSAASVSDNLPTDGTVLQTQGEKVNYALGVNLIGNFKRQGIEIDLDLVIKGMRDAAEGGKLLLNDGELRKSTMTYQEEVRRSLPKARAALVANARKEGEDFLAENRAKEGVVSLPSGLQYRIVKAGDGKVTTDRDTVECNFSGTLIDGTEVESSYRNGRPSNLKVSGLRPGWREAVTRMPVGSIWQLFVPSHLAYGERGSGGRIPPHAALIFEIELLAIK